MQNIRDIKQRIQSVTNISQITKAMEMVAAAKLRRAQERAIASRPYAEKMREVIASIARGVEQEEEHPMLQKREVKRTGYLVITSDRGLAGGYNANVIRNVMQKINDRHESTDDYVLFVIGRRGFDFFRRRDYPMIDSVIGLSDSPEYHDVNSVTSNVVRLFTEGKYDELFMHYNEFVNPMVQKPVEKKLLPLDDLEEELEGKEDQSRDPLFYEFEPSDKAVLAELLPKYAEALMYSAVLDAKASEFGARMTAMGNANDNASELIDTLTLQYNRARQAAITQEIAEIVGGAEALS